jgi:hypothetical protein
MSIKASAFALLLGAPLLLAAVPALAAPPTKAQKAAADKAAAEKAAAEKAAAEKAAAEKAEVDKAAAEKAAAEKAEADKAEASKAEKAAAEKAAAEKAAADDKNDPFEDPTKTYRFIGLRFRDAVIPKFMLNWFADGGRNVNVPMFGPEFISRRDHLEYAVALMYADYSMSPFLFKGHKEPDIAYELVQSSLKLFYATVDILYEIPLDKKGDKTGHFALLIGGGVGFAGVVGSLYRSQAYPLGNAPPDNQTQWRPCPAPGGLYCGTNNNHFSPSATGNSQAVNGKGSYEEPSWANGGSKPFVFPWLAIPQISLRYKPIKQFQTKVDLGFSTTGFFFGASASYGL